MTIIAAADGSALGNPGPSGWGWYIDDSRWACGGWKRGTNNQGELVAVLDLLRQTRGASEPLEILCDSQYVINSVTKWMHGWKRKGWKKADGKPVLNVEIMRALDAEIAAAKSAGREVTFRWVKGHAGHELNEKADKLANGAAQAYSKRKAPDAGPGFPGADAGAGAGPDPADAAEESGLTADAAPSSAAAGTRSLQKEKARTSASAAEPSLFDVDNDSGADDDTAEGARADQASGDSAVRTAPAAVGPAAAEAISAVRAARAEWHRGGEAPHRADFRALGHAAEHGEEEHAWAAGPACVMVARTDGALEVWALENGRWALASLAAGA